MQTFEQIISTIGAEISACLTSITSADVEKPLRALDRAERIFVAGVGRSGLGMRAFAMRLMHLGKPAYLVGEVTTPSIRKGDLLVIGSGSGRTESLLAIATKAKNIGAQVLLITIDPASPIGNLADSTLRLPAPSAKAQHAARTVRSVQPLASLFEQSLFILGDALILALVRKHGVSEEEMFGRHANLE